MTAIKIPGILHVPAHIGDTPFRAIIRAATLPGLITLMNDENIDASTIVDLGYDSEEKSYFVVYKA